MKSIYERIKNNIRPILQLLLLVGVFFAPRIFKITELIKTPPKLEASQKICDYVFYFAWKGGDWAIGVFFLIVVLFIIRKWNKTYMFNRGFNLLKILLKSCFFEKRLPIFKQRGIM